jgi:hypothetical protein
MRSSKVAAAMKREGRGRKKGEEERRARLNRYVPEGWRLAPYCGLRVPTSVAPSCPPWCGPSYHVYTIGRRLSWRPLVHQVCQTLWRPTVGSRYKISFLKSLFVKIVFKRTKIKNSRNRVFEKKTAPGLSREQNWAIQMAIFRLSPLGLKP